MKKLRHSSGPIIYNLFPLLVGPVRSWAEHLPRIKAMGFDYVYVNPFHLSGASGSLYAIKDTALLDPRFQSAPTDGDRVIQDFDERARSAGLAVMIDLVVNHAAVDSRLLQSHPQFFARDPQGELVTPWAADIFAEGGKVFWYDLASFNFDDAAIRKQLIAHWDAYIARFQDLGITAFRCDAAHMVPSEVWTASIGRARARRPDCVFIAETLGCTLDRAAEVAELGFDYIMSNFCYSDFATLRALVEYERLHGLAPSIAFPESHDTDRYAARFDPADTERIARELISRYLLAASFAAGVLMPIGYEWGYRRKIDVVKTSPRDIERTGVDVSAQIAEINSVRRSLAPLNVEGEQIRLSAPNDPVLLLLRGDEQELRHSREAILVIANTSNEPLVRRGETFVQGAPTFEDFTDRTPCRARWSFCRDSEFRLEPGEVRLLSGFNRDSPRS